MVGEGLVLRCRSSRTPLWPSFRMDRIGEGKAGGSDLAGKSTSMLG